MAETTSSEGPSASGVSLETSDSTLQLNIKTLDSRIYTFHVAKDTIVSVFKEKIANQSGVPVAQQRLIFRGKVLKDHHPLSEYNVENGDTLHLVERQPQPSHMSATGEAAPGNGVQGHDSNAGASRGRIGAIGHSIVLGTVNIGDPTEAAVPDLNRIIGAVLNTVGIGHQAGNVQVQHGVPSFQGNGTEASAADAGREENLNSSVPPQSSQAQSTFRAMPIPLGAAIAVPSLHMPIPDSLNTIVEFISRMEAAFSQNGNQPSLSATDGDRPGALPSNSRGLPSVEALRIVLQRAQALLMNQTIPAISRAADRLSEEAGANDFAVRGQIQTESAQLGMGMQHLGALFLELGRTLLTLRLGQSPDESSVNAGPAVYISPSGPNPIMVQPFPLQTSSLFGSTGIASNHVSMNSLGVGTIPRNVNIHIHAVGNRASNGGVHGERGSVARPNESGSGSSGITISTTASPSQGSTSSGSGVVPPSTNAPQNPELDVRSLLPDLQSDNHTSLSNPEGSLSQGHIDSQGDDVQVPNDVKEEGHGNKGLTASDQGVANLDGSSSTPIGLGLGGLQPKRRAKPPRSQAKSDDGDGTMSGSQIAGAVGQQVLRSLASLSSGGNINSLPVETPSIGVGTTGAITRQNTDDQSDVTDAMSQLLQSPALDGLLAGVSQQTGVGSPDMFRSMLQQFTQNPTMRNTVNHIAQQIDNHGLDSMFSGMDRGGPGSGIDLSRMMQQMMPIVSQALGGGVSSGSRNTPPEPVISDSRSRRGAVPFGDGSQVNLRPSVRNPENQISSEGIYQSLIERAVNSSSIGVPDQRVNELFTEELTQEFTEMLRRDITERLEDEDGS